MNRGSFQQALRLEPSFGLDYELNWGRSSVAIEFKKPLPDSTTFIVNLSTEFSDLNGNSLKEPVKIAVSTGPTINKGKITGKILDAQSGETRKGERVLLYRMPPSIGARRKYPDLSRPANYIAETDTGGTVRFSYLSPGDYLAFWLDDRDRNGAWDSETERAQPFGKEIISLSKEGSDSLGVLYIAKSDTSHPVLRGVGLFSTRRLRLRFDEDIFFTDSTKISVTDTTGVFYADAFTLFRVPEQRYILFVQSKKDLLSEQNYQLQVQNIADKAGNTLELTKLNFTGSSQADTTSQSVVYAGGASGIYPNEGVKITYSKLISDVAIRDSVIVVTADSAYKGWDSLRIQQNNLWVMPKEEWQKGVKYEVRVWDPSLEDFKKIQPTIWFESNLGGIEITFAVDSTSKIAGRPTQLLLKTEKGITVADTTFIGSVTIDNLAPTTYLLTIYQDLNNNGGWDSGKIQPYKAPEPYFIRNNVSVKAGFTGELTIAFKNLPLIIHQPVEIAPTANQPDSTAVPEQKQR